MTHPLPDLRKGLAHSETPGDRLPAIREAVAAVDAHSRRYAELWGIQCPETSLSLAYGRRSAPVDDLRWCVAEIERLREAVDVERCVCGHARRSHDAYGSGPCLGGYCSCGVYQPYQARAGR